MGFGGCGLVTPQFVAGASHVGENPVLFLTEDGDMSTTYYSSGYKSYATDVEVQRLNKIVTEVTYIPMADDAFIRTLKTGDRQRLCGDGGSGLLTVSHAANIITDVYATAGNLTIMQQAAELNPDDLVVKAEKTVSVYIGTTVNTAAEANITVNKYAEFGAEATLSLPALAALAARRQRAAQAK